MTFNNDWFRLTPQQALLSLACVGVFWVFVGGERVDCSATTEDSWICYRRSTVPLWSLISLDELDRLESDHFARISPKPSYWRRHGYAFEIQRNDPTRFQLPRKASTSEVEADRDAFVAFIKFRRGDLHLESPGSGGRRLVAWSLTLVILGATVWNVPRWWRGD